MLRISKLSDYGTLIVSQMARCPERVHSATELAVMLGLGIPTASKVLKRLARHGVVLGVRGLHGGYLLSRQPERISIADIIDALEEQPFGLTECSAATGLCHIEATCRTRASWQTINRTVRRALENVSVASMALTATSEQRIAFNLPDASAIRRTSVQAQRSARTAKRTPQ